MFGFSLAELIVVFFVIIIFIKPKDLPEIAHFLGKIYFKMQRFFLEFKSQLKILEKDLGISDLKSEINRGIATEKMKIENEKKQLTKIIDLYGNEHEVDVSEARPDLTDEELKTEIAKHNKNNS